jgi:hypothetical protein
VDGIPIQVYRDQSCPGTWDPVSSRINTWGWGLCLGCGREGCHVLSLAFLLPLSSVFPSPTSDK